MCAQRDVTLRTSLRSLATREPSVILQRVEELYPDVMKSTMCNDIVKSEPAEHNEHCITLDDVQEDDEGGVEIHVTDIRIERDKVIEVDPQPVAITFPTIKSEPEEDQHRSRGLPVFHCAVCNTSFTQKDSLKSYQRTHSGERPYKCEVCLKTFTAISSLKTHQHTQSGERPYKCDMCLRSFALMRSLKIHQHTHSGERPYKCDMCLRSFALMHSLKIHQHTQWGTTI